MYYIFNHHAVIEFILIIFFLSYFDLELLISNLRKMI